MRERGLEPGDRLTAGGLGPLAARDVLDVEHEARRAGVVAPHQRRVELDPHGVAVGVTEADVDVEAVDRVVEGAPGELRGGAAVVGVDEVGELGAGEPAGFLAERGGERPVHLEQAPVAVDQGLADGGVLEGRAEALLGLAEVALALVAVGRRR